MDVEITARFGRPLTVAAHIARTPPLGEALIRLECESQTVNFIVMIK